MRISDWSSDVCSSDLPAINKHVYAADMSCRRAGEEENRPGDIFRHAQLPQGDIGFPLITARFVGIAGCRHRRIGGPRADGVAPDAVRPPFDAHLPYHHQQSDEHTSELQSLMRTTYA